MAQIEQAATGVSPDQAGATTDDQDLAVNNRLALVKNKLHSLRVPSNATATICPLAPVWTKESNRELYEPKTVSIGPYHYEKPHLSAMQEEKWYSLRDFLSRNPSVEIDFYFEEMKLLEPAARSCYGKDVKLNADEFVEMLLLDGSFILEFYSKVASGQLDISSDTKAIISDMFLLENQIPLFVLHKLFAIHGDCRENECSGNKCTCPLLQLICECTPYINDSERYRLRNVERNFHHFLDLIYTAKLPDHARRETKLVNHGNSSSNSVGQHLFTMPPRSIPSARELSRLNIIFRPVSDIAGVTFERPNYLKIPLVVLTKSSKIMLANIVAFEQSQLDSSDCVFTRYVVLMCLLIKTDEDVVTLENYRVLQNMLPSKNEAVSFFNELAAGIFLGHANHYYSELVTRLEMFSQLPSHQIRAALIRDYYSDPMFLPNFYYAIIALVLTILQTYMAFKQK